MKLVFRADDMGYTDVNDIGAFKTITEGITTSADIMLDSPGTVGALTRMKELPWISLGWHSHCWGAPVLPPEKVPSLVDKETGRFKHDLRAIDNLDYDELIAEFRAQINRCISITGRAPDTGGGTWKSESVFSKAFDQICEEYGITQDFAERLSAKDNKKIVTKYINPKWKSRNIFIMIPSVFQQLFTDSITEIAKYNPIDYYLNDTDGILSFGEDETLIQMNHPGYMDYYMYKQGDYGPNALYFMMSRVIEVDFLCSPKMKEWIKKNNIELINMRDALYGTHEYQNHLKAINSDLCVL